MSNIDKDNLHEFLSAVSDDYKKNPKRMVLIHHNGVGAMRQRRLWLNIGRNQKCPCGSGKKFKKCHGGINREFPPMPKGESKP